MSGNTLDALGGKVSGSRTAHVATDSINLA